MGTRDDVEGLVERVRLMDWMSLGSVGGYIWVVLGSLIAGEGALNVWFIAGGISFMMLAAGRVASAAVRKGVRERTQEGEQIATYPDQTLERTARAGSVIDLAAVTGLSFSAAGIGEEAGIWTVVIGVLLAGTGFLLARATGEKIHDLRRQDEEWLVGQENDRVLSNPRQAEPDEHTESGRGRAGTRV